MQGLQDRRIVVTGAASGIGCAIARRLHDEGADLGLMDVNSDGLDELALEGAMRLPTNITDREQVEAAFERFGDVEGLVNCAGWDRMVTFLDSTPELWRQVIDINLYGTLNVTHAALRRMNEAPSASIVSIASDAGRVGSSGEAVYSACKGGMIALMKTLAREHARQGIRCNTVCPGPTDTPLLAEMGRDGGLGERIAPALARAVPMRRLGQPDDYAGIVAFLLSDDAAFITGQTISVSGGLTMV